MRFSSKFVAPKWVRHFGGSLAYFGATFALVLSFQNCGEGFKALSPNVGSSSLASEDAAAQTRFEAAKTVIAANCISCHSPTGGSVNFNFDSEQQFIAAGLITPARISESKLIYRLQNYPVADGASPGTMPPSRRLSDSDYLILTNWIAGMPAPGAVSTNMFTCSPTEEPQGLDTRKLSKIEYLNSLQSLLARPFGATEAATMLTQVNASGRIPNDAGSSFSTGDSNYTVTHAREYFDIADAVAMRIALPANYSRFVATYIGYNRGTCVYTTADTLNQTCTDTLIRNFVLRAFGRPVETGTTNNNNEMATYQREFISAANTTAGVEAMVFKTLISPQFLFHLQSDVVPSGAHYRLSSHAIARRLAFTFTQNLPDEGLLTLAGSRDLFEEAGFIEAVSYVSARMDGTVRQFVREWLKLDRLPGYSGQSHPKFAMITAGLTVDDTLRTAMVDEVLELSTFMARNNKTMRDLFTSDISFARNASLMRVYGQTSAAPATVTEQNAVRFPAGERSGILTRAGLLFQGGHTENPVLRGVHNRENLFCLTTGQPPANLPEGSLAPPVADPTLTTRLRYHAKTQGAACIGCHSQINPVGFAFSQYNSFGAFQRSEPIYNANNTFVTTLPTDGRVNLQVALGLNRDVRDAVEFSAAVPEVPSFKKCITQNFYTYAQGLAQKPASTDLSSCGMRRIYNGLEDGSTLQDFFRSAVLDRNYRYRKIQK